MCLSWHIWIRQQEGEDEEDQNKRPAGMPELPRVSESCAMAM
jgi:hypothetical protein